jgi:hypothetical protein
MNRLLVSSLAALVLGIAAAGCGALSYSFDPQEFKQSIGEENSNQTTPTAHCTPGGMPDPCKAVQAQLPANTGTVACDASQEECVATVEIRLPQEIDLRNARTPLPSDVVQFGISSVSIDKIEYWIAGNTLNVATPPLDLFVAPDAAADERDPTAVKLGTVASLPAKSVSCGDTQDPKGDQSSQGAKVCDVPLTADGQRTLAGLVKNYKTSPFKIIAHTIVTASGGTPVPAGTIDLFVRASVTLNVLK